MSEITKIQWCDHSSSPWHGCSHVHLGCTNCYAETMARRNPKTLGVWGDDGTRVKSKSFIANLRKWNREAEAAGVVQSVFPSICDPFEDRPELVPWRAEMFAEIDRCPWVRLMLLTKRPENIRRMWPMGGSPPPGMPGGYRFNVWLLTSVSDQTTTDTMILLLLDCCDLVPVRGLSIEPLLAPLKIPEAYLCGRCGIGTAKPHDVLGRDGINWCIIGGESGGGARPCNIEWIRSIVAQCKKSSIPCFVKQLGSVPMVDESWWREQSGTPLLSERKSQLCPDGFSALALDDDKGGDPNQWPNDLRVREFP